MRVKTTLLLLLAFGFSIAASAQCGGATFEEKNGIVVIEAESVSLTSSWRKQSSFSGASGGSYINWTGTQYFTSPGNGTIQYKVRINSPGTYRFNWRTRIGRGNSNTEHNDTWLRIPDAADFYGQKGGSRIYPRGTGKSPNPEGASANGWFKVYMNSLNWLWSAFTSDFDGHEIFVRFASAGVYTIQVSARSSDHLIDRMILYKTSQYSASSAQSLSRAETRCDGSTPPPPPPPGDGDDGGSGGSNNAPTVSITNPDNGQNFAAGSNISVQLSANDSDGSISRHRIFVNGNVVDTDGSNYTPHVIANAASGSYTIRAVVTDNDGATADDTVNITVGGSSGGGGGSDDGGGDTGGGSGGDNAPTVSITSPSNGQNFAVGSNVPVSLSAGDSDGSVVQHRIFVNGTLVDTDGSNFTTHFIQNVAAGSYTVRAVVTDNDGNTGEASVNFTAGNGSGGGSSDDTPDDPPADNGQGVSRIVLVNASNNTDIGVITNGSSFNSNNLPSSLSIRVDTNPANANGVIFSLSGPLSATKAEGLNPYHLFGDIGVNPIGRSFPNGSYTLVVSPGIGNAVTVNFTIAAGGGSTGGGNTPPSVSITSPNNGQSFQAGSNVAVNLSASDSDGSVVKHQIFVNGILVDTDPSNFTTHFIRSIGSGNYTVRAVVTDNDGATGEDTVNFSVGSGKTAVDTKAIAYPNPTNDGSLTVDFPRPMGKTIGYKLTSPAGQIIETGTFSNSLQEDSAQFKLRGLEQSQEGIYYLTISDGAQSFVIPVIRK